MRPPPMLSPLAALLPIDAVLALDDALAWLGRSWALAWARCDECGGRGGRRGLIVHLHTGRVNVAHHWGFCSEACRASWFCAGSAADLHPIAAPGAPYDPVPFSEEDGEVMVSVLFDDGPGRGAPGHAAVDAVGRPRFVVANGHLVAAALLASPWAVNAWWREPVQARAHAPVEMRAAA